jgi:protein-disulfide isomerase
MPGSASTGGQRPPTGPVATSGGKAPGDKGAGGKGSGSNRPYLTQSRAKAKAEAQRKRRQRNVAIAAVGLIVVAIVIGLVVQSSRSSTSKKAAIPTAATGPGGSFTMGTGPVLVEQYGDFQCPHCEEWFQTVEPTAVQLANEGKITFAFHNFAFIGQESTAMANAAACAGDVGKFWPMHDYMYNHQQPENSGFWTTDQLIAALETVGASTPQTEQCVKSGKYNTWVSQQADAASKRGVTATPTVYVNNQVLNDNTDPQALIAAVNAAAAKK